MGRISSIHIEAGNIGYLFHNDRSKPTANSIFSQEKNEYSTNAQTALKIYHDEMKKRTKAYTEKTGKKLPKNTLTHLSAIVNLDERHTLEDMQKVAKYLEETLGTKVFQIAIHKDEGYKDETGEHINYHAHLEMLGLDENGRSVRKKLTRKYLIRLQDRVAEILQMERGINYTKERKKRPKRLNTYEYKEHARRMSIYKRAVYKLIDFAKNEMNFTIKNESDLNIFLHKISNQRKAIDILKENDINGLEELQEFLHNTQNSGFFSDLFGNLELRRENKQLKQEIERLRNENAGLKQQLAKVKDLKEENKKLRELLKEHGAQREQYAQLEAFVRELKERIKAKDLTIEQLREQMQQKEQQLLSQISQLKNAPKPEPQPQPKVVEKIVYREDTAKIEDLEQKLAEERAKNEELSRLLQEKEREIEELREQLRELQNLRYIERKKHSDEIKELRARIKELERNRGKMEDSYEEPTMDDFFEEPQPAQKPRKKPKRRGLKL